ncbi:MAG: hypothetical protein HY868_16075 [Chloroflexi bacterium]|nr:hypothetical protein [Chloroflexota bacterium]
MRFLLSARLSAAFLILVAILALAYAIHEYLASNRPKNPLPSFVILRWSTRHEVNTLGYVIYRAESATGPFTQINRELVLAANDPYLGGTYTFTDTETIAGVTYYYQLEDVDLNGEHTRQDPIAVIAHGASPTIFGHPLPEMIPLIAFLIAAVLLLLGTTLWITRGK